MHAHHRQTLVYIISIVDLLGYVDSVEYGTVEWNSGTVEWWNSGMVGWSIDDP